MSTFKVQSPLVVLDEDAKIHELLLEYGKEWNFNLISKIFWDQEANIILSIPISQRGGEDKMIWCLTEKGTFIVKSVFAYALQLRQVNNGEPSYYDEQDRKWKILQLY